MIERNEKFDYHANHCGELLPAAFTVLKRVDPKILIAAFVTAKHGFATTTACPPPTQSWRTVRPRMCWC